MPRHSASPGIQHPQAFSIPRHSACPGIQHPPNRYDALQGWLASCLRPAQKASCHARPQRLRPDMHNLCVQHSASPEHPPSTPAQPYSTAPIPHTCYADRHTRDHAHALRDFRGPFLVWVFRADRLPGPVQATLGRRKPSGASCRHPRGPTLLRRSLQNFTRQPLAPKYPDDRSFPRNVYKGC